VSNRKKLPKKQPAHRSHRRPEKLIDKLGQARSITRMTIGGLFLAVVGIVLTLVFGLWSSSPEPVIGKPIPATTGGKNPAALFQDQPCANEQGTAIILYSLRNAVTCPFYSQLKKPPVLHLGTPQTESYCASGSYVIPRPGVYHCVIQVNNINTIADPCFGVSKGQVECQLPDGIFGLLNVINVANPKPHNPSLSELGHVYPFRLLLDNGMACTSNWLSFMGHTGGGWICAIPLRVIEFRPERDNKLLYGRDALNFKGAFVAGTNNLYYAEDLIQGNQSTWSVLLESPDNPGVFTRESVTEAWY
jgi:hypothetical protein